MTEPTTKKVKAVKAALVTTPADQVAPVKEKPAKPAKPEKLKFEPVTTTVKISAADVKSAYNSLLDLAKDSLMSDNGGNTEDFNFLDNHPKFLEIVIKNLQKGLDPTQYLDAYDMFEDLPDLEKVFAKEIKAVLKAITEREDAEQKAKDAAARTAAELDARYGGAVRVKKADNAKAEKLLTEAGIEFIYV